MEIRLQGERVTIDNFSPKLPIATREGGVGNFVSTFGLLRLTITLQKCYKVNCDEKSDWSWKADIFW